jgi:hypothetical protein
MTKYILSSLFLFALLVSCVEEPTAADRQFIVEVGDVVDLDFKMTLAELSGGGTVNLADYLGKVIMIQFTTWDCSMSFSKMGYIESEIWQKHKNNADFKLLGIARRGENTPERVEDLIYRTRVTYPIARDPNQEFFMRFARKDGGATRDILIGKDGEIVMLTRYFSRDRMVEFNELVDKINTLLEE